MNFLPFFNLELQFWSPSPTVLSGLGGIFRDQPPFTPPASKNSAITAGKCSPSTLMRAFNTPGGTHEVP